MNKVIPLFAVICVLAGCSKEAPPGATSPSPLLTADRDRLWILLRASPVGDGRACDDYYLNPDDPRYQGRAQQCDFWTRHFADFLRINGFPMIEHQHLKEPAYWQWYVEKRGLISHCIKAVGTLSVTATGHEMAEHARLKHECDPYDDARNNQDMTPANLGIRYK